MQGRGGGEDIEGSYFCCCIPPVLGLRGGQVGKEDKQKRIEGGAERPPSLIFISVSSAGASPQWLPGSPGQGAACRRGGGGVPALPDRLSSF